MKFIYTITLAFGLICNLQAQTSFTYDAAGNRLAKDVSGSIPALAVSANPATVGMNQPSTLQAQGCTGGAVNWSTGHQSVSFVAYPCQTQTYYVTCQVASCPNQQSTGQVTVTQTSPFTNTVLTSQKTGNWNDPTVWCCGRIPTLADKVIIYPTHTVTITDNTARAKSLGFDGTTSRIQYLPAAQLRIGGN